MMEILQDVAKESRVEVERLSRRFAETFERLKAGFDVFAPHVFFDLNMPVWRFQLIGADAFSAQLRLINQGPIRIDAPRTVTTHAGCAPVQQEHQDVDGEDLTARRLWLCSVNDGRISE